MRVLFFRLWLIALAFFSTFFSLFCSAGALAVPFVQPTGPAVPVLYNSTVTGNGSLPIVGLISGEVDLIVNITGLPSGTLPTLTFTVSGSDPQAPATTISGDATASTSALNSISTTAISISPLRSSAVNVSWTIGGTGSPTFSGVYVTLAIKSAIKPPTPPSGTPLDGGLTLDGGVLFTFVDAGPNPFGPFTCVGGWVTANISTPITTNIGITYSNVAFCSCQSLSSSSIGAAGCSHTLSTITTPGAGSASGQWEYLCCGN